MQDYTTKYLQKQGFTRYEVSAFCKEGFKSKHNLKYWNLDDYLGLGIAAHSKIGKERFANTSNLKTYLKNIENNELIYENKVTLTKQDEKEEFIMLSLRKKEGIDLEQYKNLFNDDLTVQKEEIIKTLQQQNLIKLENNHLFLTNNGFNVLNLVIEKLV
jgi:oxygen-independent coproporphyrinogen-3 oxidase